MPISVYVAAWSVIRHPLAAHWHRARGAAADPLATVRAAAAAAAAAAKRLDVVVHGRHGGEQLDGVWQLRQPFEKLLMRVGGEGGGDGRLMVGVVGG